MTTFHFGRTMIIFGMVLPAFLAGQAKGSQISGGTNGAGSLRKRGKSRHWPAVYARKEAKSATRPFVSTKPRNQGAVGNLGKQPNQ